MDSLPVQHIESLPEEKRREAYRQIALVCAGLSQNLPKEDVARGAHFSSAEDMQFRLERWGLSGLVPQDQGSEKAPKKKRERKGRVVGPVEDLPPASEATPLFREKLSLLAQANEDLKYRREKRQAGRFILSMVDTSPQVLRRRDYADDEWQEYVNLLGLDANSDLMYNENGLTFSIGGGSHVPLPPLPVLIAIHALTGGDMEALFQLLVGGTLSNDRRETLRRLIDGNRSSGGREDGLKLVVDKLATLMRGGNVGGKHTEHTSPVRFNLMCRINAHREAGMSDKEIFKRLRHFKLSEDSDGLTRDEFDELAESEAKWPWDLPEGMASP